jgi:FtsP/CotA-like multicopper oxidase with cupredoxin domain
MSTERLSISSTVTTNAIGQSFIGSANNISFTFPSFPLLVSPEHVHEDMFCDVSSINVENCPKLGRNKICRCIHRIKYKLGSIAEMILVNVLDRIVHPMHLHGHKFHVMDSGNLTVEMPVEEVKRRIPKKNAKHPPYKDTVLLPYPGYVRMRFRANNPGYWLFHCHFDWHLPIGLKILFCETRAFS